MSPHAPNIAREPEGIAGNADRVSALAANVEALRARFGREIDRAVTIPPHLTVSVPAQDWPEDAVPRSFVRLGVLCRTCGQDEWTTRRGRTEEQRWRVCLRCERTKALARWREGRKRRRARAALAVMDGKGRMT